MPVLDFNLLIKNMLNDKGFSRIISVIVVIIIIILIGFVISINSVDDNKGIKLVDIIENDINNSVVEPISTTYEFVGLDISVGGYKVASMIENSEASELIGEKVDGQYNLLTKTLNKNSVLLVKDFYQDKDFGGKKLMEMEIKTGQLDEVFELPNAKVGDFSRFII